MPYSDDEQTPLRRPSHTFLDQPIGSFKGPNSLHNFASSFTRAQIFSASKLDNDIHKKRSFFTSPSEGSYLNGEDDEHLYDADLMVPSSRGERLSVVFPDISHRNQIFMNEQISPHGSNDVFYADDYNAGYRSRHNSVYTNAIPVGKKLYPSKSFASIRSAISAVTTASQFNLKQIEDKDGHVITVVSGQSTAPQTVFNSINVLIGVGLLALPVGIMKAGWVFGIPLLVACGLTTFWTATLLSRTMDTDPTIMTYADLGYAAYGSYAKLIISFLFSIDLLGAGVALVVLLSDSLFALLGDDTVWTKTNFKLVSFLILTPFTFMPLPVLSIFSLFGIMATVSITCLVFILGFLKQDAPGSLLSMMPTNLWPQSTPDLLLSIGILMAPFGGHAIFPNLKSDMRHPYKFAKTLIPTYATSLITDMSMGILGFLMFGRYCNNEITNNILFTAGYPSWCYPLISGLICLVPLAKTPLNAKPIISTLDVLFGIDNVREGNYFKNWIFSLSRFTVRIGVNATFVALAILFPEFDRVIGILGASICFTICIILPCLFYLKICGNDIGAFERLLIRVAILISTVLAVIGTWAVLQF
ncbi:vacuolar amino acid transporter 1 [[Candida] anglica]|uniref:Vacuolar amino acid transporter 1 n=1 Tax=[Candida] anglica TaxID=148631 RepID=A0ABP0EDD1_9ASCO